MTLPPDSVIIALLVLYALFLAVYVPVRLRNAEQRRKDWWVAVQEQERAAHARDQADQEERRDR